MVAGPNLLRNAEQMAKACPNLRQAIFQAGKRLLPCQGDVELTGKGSDMGTPGSDQRPW